MAISFPRSDIFTGVGLLIDRFELFERQEYSRSADGVTRGKSFGEALWVFSATTVPMFQSNMLTVLARLRSLDGVVNRFYFGDGRRIYPASKPDGDFTDSGAINSINGNNKALSLKSLPANFVLSVGDYLQFTYGSPAKRALHQVMESVTANGSGVTAEFEVRPHIRAGAATNDVVVLKQPTAMFALDPNSVKENRVDAQHYSISFSGFQVVE